jgi:Tfp pilus assembly protein FimV
VRLIDDLFGRGERPPARRRPRRYEREYSLWTFVAPAVLLVCVVIITSLVRDGLRSDPATTTTVRTATTSTTTTAAKAKPKSRFYVVKSGDTLSAIAERVGVALEDLQRLNPKVTPQSLVPGQRLRLR